MRIKNRNFLSFFLKPIINKTNETLSCGYCNHSRRAFLSNCAKCIGTIGTVGAFSGLVVPTMFAAGGCLGNSKKPEADTAGFEGGVSREVLESYLNRSLSLTEFLHENNNRVDGEYSLKKEDIRLIKETGAKFIHRAIYRWKGIAALNKSEFWQYARNLVSEMHLFDPEIIFQAGVFEAVFPDVELLAIPDWAFEALDMPVEKRNFVYKDMLSLDGKYEDMWGDGGVPDITRSETQLWFIYLMGSYVDVGCEAIHFGQVALVGMNDPELAHWANFLAQAREYLNPRSRRHYILFDAHTPTGGMVVNGVSLLDFNAFPMRIKAIEGKPLQGVLEKGFLDSFYGRSMACITPSGWSCDALPYLLEFDNFGVSDHPGEYRPNDYFPWGYDEITWLYMQPVDYRKQFLKYAHDWIRKTDLNGYLSMPGSRLVVTSQNDPIVIARAIAPSELCPYGMDLENTIKEIWGKKKSDFNH